MGSKRRILENSEEVASLLSIRDELYRNTVKIIDLVRERMRLAEEIGKEKAFIGAPLRDHGRELEVLDSIPSLGEVERSILNMVFELTILNEMGVKPSLGNIRREARESGVITLSGPHSILEYTMGLIISYPGFELVDSTGIPENLAVGIVQRGGHITSSRERRTDGRIVLVNSAGTIMATLKENTMTISPELFSRDSRNEMMEAI